MGLSVMRTAVGILLIGIIVVVCLFLPAPAPVNNSVYQQVIHMRTQSLAMLGLPIVITRPTPHISPDIRYTPTPGTTTYPVQSAQSTEDMMLWMLEQANIVRVATVQTYQPVVATDTATPTSTAVVAPATHTETLTPSSTATAPAASEPTVTSTIQALPRELTVTPVLLPQRILDGFRSRMPEAGYWVGYDDGIRVAVSSFQYAPQLYSSLPRDKMRFITLTVQIHNTRDPSQPAIYADRTYMTLRDIDGYEHLAELVSDDLTSGFIASTVAPQQQVTGQLAFQIGRYAAPAQLIVHYANQDTYQSRRMVVIEFRVWPIVQ